MPGAEKSSTCDRSARQTAHVSQPTPMLAAGCDSPRLARRAAGASGCHSFSRTATALDACRTSGGAARELLTNRLLCHVDVTAPAVSKAIAPTMDIPAAAMKTITRSAWDRSAIISESATGAETREPMVNGNMWMPLHEGRALVGLTVQRQPDTLRPDDQPGRALPAGDAVEHKDYRRDREDDEPETVDAHATGEITKAPKLTTSTAVTGM